jgi:hypothetical protein
MRKMLFMFVVLFLQSISAQMVENFDGSWTRWDDEWMNTGSSIIRTYDTNFKIEGTASLKLQWNMQAEDWGGGISFARNSDPGNFIDMSTYDTLSLSYYVEKPAKNGNCYIALILRDNPISSLYDADPSNVELWRHQIHGVLEDSVPGWHTISIPLKTVGDPLAPTSEDWKAGFNMQGSRHHNDKLDWDYIRGFYLEINTDTALHVDDGVIYLDNMVLSGSRATPLVLFNGRSAPNNVSFSVGWTGSAVVSNEEDYDNAGTGSIKWTGGSDADGGGWDGIWFSLEKTHKLGELMSTDTLQFAIKAPAGLGDFWLAFADEDNDGAGPDRMYQNVYFLEETAIGGYTNNWQLIRIPLRDFYPAGSWDPDRLPGSVDSNHVIQFRIEGNGQSVENKIVYFDNIWTGNYSLDIIAPAAPQVQALAISDYLNGILWTDVPGEKQEIYRVYTSQSPITDLNADGIEVVKFGIAEGVQTADHTLKYPLIDKDVTYYYAVVCLDNAGNESPLGLAGPVTNLAKGIAVINETAPPNFTADGNLSEWSNIKPFRMFPSDGSGHIAANTIVDNDADLSINAYLALDSANLYVAFDVTDDIISVDPNLGEWENDLPDLFIGLYNQVKLPHISYTRGKEPDYRFMFDRRRLFCGRPWVDSLILPGANYYWDEKFPSGYVVEAKIPWTTFVLVAGDSLFTPQAGMKIPLDIAVNDADATGSREGMISLSVENNDISYYDVSAWTYTWIGDKTTVGVEDQQLTVLSYSLSQNYPNPFNPTTLISYSLPKSGFVTLKVFDVLGREVTTLVNQNQNSGSYNITFNASNLSTGVYFYKLEAGEYLSIKKMLLIK